MDYRRSGSQDAMRTNGERNDPVDCLRRQATVAVEDVVAEEVVCCALLERRHG